MSEQEENEQELLDAFRKSLPVFQKSLLLLTKECAKRSACYSTRETLGADMQAISIKVLPSSVASR